MKTKIIVDEISLESYPYAYARVATMKGRLLKKEDYDKLRKMKLAEIAKFLEESEYKREIDELSVSYGGASLLDMALNKNLVRTIEKVRKISSEELRQLIDAYLMRITIRSVKMLLRAKYAKLGKEEMKKELLYGTGDEKLFGRLADADSVEEFLNRLGFTKTEKFKKAVEYYKSSNSISLIENSLDNHYYKWLTGFLGKVSESASREILLREIDLINIKTIIRLKQEGVGTAIIKQYVLSGHRLKAQFLEQMLEAKNSGEIATLLKKTIYGNLVSKYIDELENNKYVNFEIALDKSLLGEAQKLMRKNPLSAEVILGYIMAKEIEVRNINVIIKSRLLNMPEDVVSRLLI